MERARLIRSLLLALGLALGLVIALPVPAAHCPSLHEGYLLCAAQTVWPRVAVEILAPVLALQLLATLVLHTLPRLFARWRAGLRPVRMTRRQRHPPYDRDPFLLAASWGVKTGAGSRRRRR